MFGLRSFNNSENKNANVLRMKDPVFDRSNLETRSLSERVHDLSVIVVKELDFILRGRIPEEIIEVGKRIVSAKQRQKAVILMMGAHVLRSGVQRCRIDLMERGYISCLSTNGAGVIHRFSLFPRHLLN